MFKSRLDIETPGSIVWMGHSFGGATITQFLKSVWYHPKFAQSGELKEPLYIPSDNLLRHFHPDGTITANSRAPTTILLDLWCLPLLGDRTRLLWKLPLPGPTIGILSEQFFKWKENLRGFRHMLNRKGGVFEAAWFSNPDKVEQVVLPASSESTKDQVIPQIKKVQRSSSLDVTPQLPKGFSRDDEAKLAQEEEEVIEDEESLSLQRTQSRASQSPGVYPDRKLYYVMKSAHLSQSDFGVLFPRSARYFAKVEDSEGVLDLNVRAVTEFMREQGIKVAPFSENTASDKQIFGEEPVLGWDVVSLELGEEGLVKKEIKQATSEKDASKL
ncbi:hypothetical protein ABW19_dt0201295 [Dactylella cylindrospora]|nr:hypothetical protein ABW19_dt0201295 [Dactylella cylindrospora]